MHFKLCYLLHSLMQAFSKQDAEHRYMISNSENTQNAYDYPKKSAVTLPRFISSHPNVSSVNGTTIIDIPQNLCNEKNKQSV